MNMLITALQDCGLIRQDLLPAEMEKLKTHLAGYALDAVHDSEISKEAWDMAEEVRPPKHSCR